MKTARQILATLPESDVIILIAESLEAAIEHSGEPSAWKTPKEERTPFYYAYSHASYICACLWAKRINDGVEADTFMDLLYNPPEDMVTAVKELLLPQQVG